MRMKYAKNDFTDDSLPLTRKAQFWSIFKIEWRTIFGIGLLILIPFVIFASLELLKTSVIAGINSYAGTEHEGSIKILTVYTEIIYTILLSIPYVLFALILSGVAKVYQRLIYGEGLLFRSDFILGIKQNFKQILIITLIYCAFNIVTMTCYSFLSMMSGVAETLMSGLLIGMFYFIISPFMFIAPVLSSTYQMNMKTLISNSFKIFTCTLLIPLLFAVLYFGFRFLNAIPNIGIIILVQTISVYLFLPTLMLVCQMYLTSVFDRVFNENCYPEIYLKGLRDYNFLKEKNHEHHNEENN